MSNTLIIGLTPPLEGGSERHIFEIAQRNPNSRVLTQRGSNCSRKIELPIIANHGFIQNISFFISSLVYSIFLLITFKKKYQVIHIHENLLYFLVPFLRMRYSVVVTIHGIAGFKFYDNRFLWRIFRTPLYFANKIIAVSPPDQALLKKYFSQLVYIPNGVELKDYSLKKRKIEKKIGFIGRIHEQKGVKYLLEAFTQLEKKDKGLQLELLGEVNDYARELQRKYPSKNILWAGYITDRKEIARRLSNAYCIVLPSLWEGLPLTLFEALATGRPVIVSDIPSFTSVIKDEAIFSKKENAHDIELKIATLLVDSKRALALGKKGRMLAEEYSWERIAKKTIDAYPKY